MDAATQTFSTDEYPALWITIKQATPANQAPIRAVKFNLYNVTNGAFKARVWYSLDNHVDRKPCVTIYAKDYTNDLHKIIADGYVNNTDSMTDYFEQGRVHLREGHPLYKAARAAAERAAAKRGK